MQTDLINSVNLAQDDRRKLSEHEEENAQESSGKPKSTLREKSWQWIRNVENGRSRSTSERC